MRRTLAREGFLNSRRVAVSAVVSVGTGGNLSRGRDAVKQNRRAAGTRVHGVWFQHTSVALALIATTQGVPIPDMLPSPSTRLRSVLAIVNRRVGSRPF